MIALKTRVPEELVKELEARFPPKRHEPDENHSEIMYYSGQLRLVDFLRRNCELQKENLIT